MSERSGPVVERDPSGQILELDVPESCDAGSPFLRKGVGDSGIVSAAALVQKAKAFDDGLYAAVEIAALHGRGKLTAKSEWLRRLRQALGANPAATSLYAAVRMIAPDVEVPDDLANGVAARVESFLADDLLSKPISFYTWSEDLAAIFRHDRLLQQELDPDQLKTLIRVIHSDASLRKDYETYLELIARLTNPLQTSAIGRALIPPSVSHEVSLMEKLYGNRSVPEGFDLMTELVERVRSRAIDLRPRPESGWYDHQVWALSSLALPGDARESERLRFSSQYRGHLVELFKGSLALTRETHAKQISFALAGCFSPEIPRRRIVVKPQLSCEPLATFYRRRADSYRFVRGVLEKYVGADEVGRMNRLTEQGPAELDLQEELTFMIGLFDGAASTAEREIGSSDSDSDRSAFTNWDRSSDPDLTRDVRMMVPVFYDVERRKTKVWAMLGWVSDGLRVAFRQPPEITVRVGGKDLTREFEIEFEDSDFRIAHPIFAEVYVDRLLDREEFRALCDRHDTREEVVAALQKG